MPGDVEPGTSPLRARLIAGAVVGLIAGSVGAVVILAVGLAPSLVWGGTVWPAVFRLVGAQYLAAVVYCAWAWNRRASRRPDKRDETGSS